MNSIELQDKKNTLLVEMRSLIDKAKEEVRDLTEEEKNDYEGKKSEVENINKQLEELNKRYKTDITSNMNEKEFNRNKPEVRFSLLSAIRNVANGKHHDEVTASILERGQQEFRGHGMSYSGQIQLPSIEERASLTVQAEGTDIVATNLFDVITPIKKKNVLVASGAKYIGGLSGNLLIPSVSNASVEWADETGTAVNGEPTIASTTYSPKRLSCVVEVSKQFLIQSSVDAEQLLRELIIDAINNKLESTILGNTAGTNNKPAGLFHGQNPTTINSFQTLCDFESALEDVDSPVYIVSHKAKSALRNMAKSTKSTALVFENGEIDGTKALVTTRMAEQKGIIYGDMSKVVITQFGAIDIVVDTISLSHKGMVRLVLNCFYDAKLAQAGALAFGKIA